MAPLPLHTDGKYIKDANGHINYMSSNASYVFINVISGLDSNGASIFVKKGTYPISKGTVRPGCAFYQGLVINGTNNLWIIGEGPATIFQPQEKLARIFTFT